MHINDLILIDELHEVFQDEEGQKYIHNGYEFITIEENTKVAIMEAIEGEKINTIRGVETYIQDYIEIHRELPYITQIDEEAINEIIEDKLGSLITDKDVALEEVKYKGEVLFWVSDELKNDKEVVIEAVKQDGNALGYASAELRNDKDVVLEAVKQNGMALKWSSDELRNNKEVVLDAVKQDGCALGYASDELKNDKEIVFAAVRQNGMALLNASDELRNNKEIVFAAVKENGMALYCASDNLKNNKDILNTARDLLMSDKWRNLAQYQQIEFIDLKEKLIKYDRGDELLSKLAELDKLQAQQNSINQPKAEVKSRRKV